MRIVTKNGTQLVFRFLWGVEIVTQVGVLGGAGGYNFECFLKQVKDVCVCVCVLRRCKGESGFRRLGSNNNHNRKKTFLFFFFRGLFSNLVSLSLTAGLISA